MPDIRQEGHIRPMNISDLERVLGWRNHPDIRSAMTTQHEISLGEHQTWFEKSQSNARRTLLIYEEREALGFANLEENYPGTFIWGFYTAPGTARGTGRALCQGVLDYAFGQKSAHKICGQVLLNNEKSIRLHQTLGFRHEGTLREHCLIGSIYHDLICFGLLKTEWATGN